MSALQSKSDRWLPLIPAGLAAVLVLLAAMSAGIGHYQRAKAEAMRSWPSTRGTITSSGFTTNRRPGDSRVEVREVVSFNYQVEGKPYTVTNVAYLGYAEQVERAEPKYRDGSTVPVYFDPKDPSDASLTNEREAPYGILVGVALGCLLVSAPFWYVAARMLRRRGLARRDA